MDEVMASSDPLERCDDRINDKESNDIENMEIAEDVMEVEENKESTEEKDAVCGSDEEKDTINFILSNVLKYLEDPKQNPLRVLQMEMAELQEKIETKNAELVKLQKMFEMLVSDQIKFLRHIGAKPQGYETRTVEVQVNLPWERGTVSNLIPEGPAKSDAVSAAKSEAVSAAKSEAVSAAKSETVSAAKSETVSVAKSETMSAQPNSSGMRASVIHSKPPKKKEATRHIECIDLTDEGSVSSVSANSSEIQHVISSSARPKSSFQNISQSPGFRRKKHPAPLPSVALLSGEDISTIPPKPRLKISVAKNGIILKWDLPPLAKSVKITGYEIYGYQERNDVPPSGSLWKKIGTVNPMPLPMSCTLTQFVEGYKYHFSVRGIGKGKTFGHYSDPTCITLLNSLTKTI